MSKIAPSPGEWPADAETLAWMHQLACHYLGSDYQYLADDVVSRVTEDWAEREVPENDRARIETRLRSKASDLRKAEQRRKSREDTFRPDSKFGSSTGDDARVDEMEDALKRSGVSEQTCQIVRLIAAGESVASIERSLGLNRYMIQKQLLEVGQILWPERFEHAG